MNSLCFSLGELAGCQRSPIFYLPAFLKEKRFSLKQKLLSAPNMKVKHSISNNLSLGCWITLRKRSIPLSIVILSLFTCINNKTIPQFNRSCSTRLWLLRFHCFSLRKTENFHFLLLASQAGSKFSEELCFFASLKSEQIGSIEKTARVFSTCSLFKKRFTEFTACLKGASNGKHWKNSWSEEKE